MKPKILLLGLICGLALAAETGAELFQKAVVQERAAGNLEEAIKLYQRVAKEFASDRALAAKALVQAARCYEKLGQDKAIKLYEQVARDFGDQRESAGAARERLAAISAVGRAKTSPGMVARQIPALTTGRLKQSDGRHVFYISRDGLVVSGMDGSGAKVIVPNPAGASVNAGVITNFVVSRDGKQIAFGLLLKGNKESIRVVGVDGSGAREVYDMSQLGARPMSSATALRGRILDWSPDGSRILAACDQEDRTTSLMSISASDGTARVLANGASLSPAKFSPDGKYVAYTVSGSTSNPNPFLSPEMDIDIVAVDRSYSGKLVEHPGGDKLLDWTPDGAYILFLTNRTGAPSIFAQAVSQGRPQGDPIPVKQDSGDMGYASMAKDGSLYYLAGSGTHDELFLASLDPVHGTVSANPKRIAERGRETQRGGAWSSDGSLFAYQAASPGEGPRHRLIVRTAKSGQEREFRLDGGVSGTLCWAPDNATLYVAVAVGAREQFSLHSVSATTGEAKQIAVYPRNRGLSSISLSHDGKALLMGFRDMEPMLKSLPLRAFVLRRDLATGEETELISKEGASEIAVSPDGTRAAALDFPTGPDASVSLKPLNGGDWKQSAPIAGLRVDSLQWMPDGNSVVFSASGARSSLFTLSWEGGNPKKLAEFPEYAAAVRAAIHPDGQQILLRMTIARSELWALENLLPYLATLAAKSKAGTGMVARQIPTSFVARTQSDGKHLFYIDYAKGGLMVSGMDGLGAKVLFATTGIPGNGQIVLVPSISRDGSQIAFKLRKAVDTICIVGADGSGFREIYKFGARAFASLGGWSSDGRQLLAFIPEPDGTNASLVSISVADGSTRKLVSGGLPNPRTSSILPWAQFSPDGKYVAYSTGGGSTGGVEGSQSGPAVYVAAVDGSSSSKLLDRSSMASLLDWTPDGRHVLFLSDRTGTAAIYAVAVPEGNPKGDAILVKQDAGRILQASVRKDGTMWYTVYSARPDLFLVNLDPARGFMTGAPLRLSERLTEHPLAGAWSADGRQLAYTVFIPSARDRHKVVIRNLASGEERELIVQGLNPGPLCWAPDGGSIYDTSSLGGRWVMQSVELTFGAVKQVAAFEETPHSILRTRDGKALLINLHETRRLHPSVVRHDLETGEETELVSKDLAFRLTVSPDGSRVAAVDTAPGGIMSLSVKPLNGGEWTRIATIAARSGDSLQWTPDGASLRFVGYVGEAPVLWGIPAEGGKIEKLAEFPGWSGAGALAMRPDGQQALLTTSMSRPELWSLENFLTKLQAAR